MRRADLKRESLNQSFFIGGYIEDEMLKICKSYEIDCWDYSFENEKFLLSVRQLNGRTNKVNL